MGKHKPAFDRRSFLVGTAALGAGAALAGPAVASASSGAPSERVGAFEVVALLDGTGPFPRPRQWAFPSATETDWAAARRVDPGAFGPGDTWRLNFHCFAIRRPGGRTTLVDTGIGPAGGPASGWAPVPGHLPTVLPHAGIDPADVDMVVLTHLHEDHFGWSVSPEGVPMFPNARYVLQHNEIAGLGAGDIALSYVVDPLRRTGQLHEIDGRTRLAGGHRCRVTAVPTPGHTVGHQSVLVEGPNRDIVITGDVLVHAVQLVNPEVGYHFEADPAAAVRSRQELFATARRRRSKLATAHLTRPFVGVPG